MTGEHVEVRVTGPQEAVDVVLRLLRTGGPGITGGGARGPYPRRNGNGVAYYAHLRVDVAAAAATEQARTDEGVDLPRSGLPGFGLGA